MNIDFDEIGDDLEKIGRNGKIVFSALGQIHGEYRKLEPTARASMVADVKTLSTQLLAIGIAMDALEQDDDIQKLGGAVQLARTLAQAVPIAKRVMKDLESVAGADYAVIKPQAITIINALEGNQQ